MSARTLHQRAFAKVEADVLKLMEDCRKLRLSTAVELLELTLAEVRDRAKEPGPA